MSRRVAVIAVHGVGHHQPLEAAKAAADLLAAARPDAYSPFVQSALRIPVRRLEVGDPPAAPGKAEVFEERPHFVRESTNPNHPDLAYMREQLSAFEPADEDL